MNIRCTNLLRVTALAMLTMALPCSSAIARDVGRWVIGSGQGVIEYSIYNDNKDQTYFIISDASMGASGGVDVYISVNGKAPRPHERVIISIDGSQVDFMADGGGTIKTNCHVCASNFDFLWKLIRRGNTMRVRFGAGEGVFSLRGAAKILDRDPPKADFYR